MRLSRKILSLLAFPLISAILPGCSGGVIGLPEDTLPPGLLLDYNPQTGKAPIAVTFNISAETRDSSTPYITFESGEDWVSTREIANDETIHVYSRAGTYTTTISVRDGLGQTSTSRFRFQLHSRTQTFTLPAAGTTPAFQGYRFQTVWRQTRSARRTWRDQQQMARPTDNEVHATRATPA